MCTLKYSLVVVNYRYTEMKLSFNLRSEIYNHHS